MILSSCLLFILVPRTCLSASPVNVTVTPEVVNVTVEQDEAASVTVTTTVGEVMSVITAGEQGIPGPPGPPGPAGPPGPPGSGGGSSLTVDQQAAIDNANSPVAANPFATKADIPAAPVNADWDASGGLAQILNKPTFLRGYDGREIELQTSATHIQWSYVSDPPGPWINLVPLADLAGTDGADGLDGRTILNGSGVPSNALGSDGDYYLDTALIHLYGPKAAGAWPGTYIELVGPQGEPGPPGPAGNIDSPNVRAALDDPIDGAVVWIQQGPTEAATEPKIGVKDRLGNSKQWVDGNGTVVRQCITADSAPAFKLLGPAGATIYTLSCDNTMVFSGTVTIK